MQKPYSTFHGVIFPVLILILCTISTGSSRLHDTTNDVGGSSGESIAKFGANENFSFAERRFLIYGVNPGEGFNLRRDVYMRVANAVRQLRERGHDYILVLPPWNVLYHWYRRGETAKLRQEWRQFFDVKSMSRFVPVVEFEEFLAENGAAIDLVLYLQHYAEGWDADSGFQLKYDERACMDADRYYREENGKIQGAFFGHGDTVHANGLKCLSIQGQSSTLADAILGNFSRPMSLLVDRAETILHDHFGDEFYWRARRSMRYAKHLIAIADEFRRNEFNSTDESDGVPPLSDNWELDEGRPRLTATSGGAYLAVHWRRADFLNAHRRDLPTVEGTAAQILRLCARLNLRNVYLSTDADAEEVEELTAALNEADFRVGRFHRENPSEQLSEGEVSIVDQWICAHAKYFIGTHLSTFSFRIHEDREILGFAPETTFNRLCPDAKADDKSAPSAAESHADEACEQPAKWTIVYS